MVNERQKSVLLTDPEQRKKFLKTAYFYANSMAEKYPVISRVYDPYSVVGDVVKKILLYGIDYDASKGKNFNGFVHMLVNREYIDIFRRMKKEATTISLDDCPLYDGAVPLYKTLEATKDVINAVDDEVVLEQFFVLLKERKRNAKRKDSNNSVITLENILKLKVGGFTNKDIADLFKVRPSRIHNMIVRNRGMLSELLERCFGDDVACIPSL